MGQKAAQLIHAAGESAALNPPSSGTYAVALEATHSQLMALEHELTLRQIKFVPIREPDAPFLGELVAIGIAPQARTNLRKVLGSFRLIGVEK